MLTQDPVRIPEIPAKIRLKDKDGNYWIGIFQKGVIMIPASRNNFHYYGYKSALNNFIGSNCITAIHLVRRV